MSVEVKIPTVLKKYTGGKRIIKTDTGSIISIVNDIISAYPGLKVKLLNDEGNIRKHINICLNEEKISIPDDLDRVVEDKDRILIILAITGG